MFLIVFVPIALKSQLSAHSYILTVLKSLSGYYIEDFVWFCCFLNSLCWNRFEEWNDRAFDVSCDAEVSGRNPQSIQRKARGHRGVRFFHLCSKTSATLFVEVRADPDWGVGDGRSSPPETVPIFYDVLRWHRSWSRLWKCSSVEGQSQRLVTGWGFWKQFCTGDSCHFFSCVLLFHTRYSRCYQVNDDWNLW